MVRSSSTRSASSHALSLTPTIRSPTSMSFRPEEVSAVLAQELERYEAKLETKSVGTVLSVGDGIARIWGLEDAMAGELLEFPGNVIGMVLNLEQDNVGAVLF